MLNEILVETAYGGASFGIESAELVERGLPTSSIAELRELGLNFAEVAEVVISPRTLKHRQEREENLSPVETDRVLRVFRIVELATRVFGNASKGLAWLRMADDRLHNRTPMSLLQTESGGRVVEGMLWGIDEGVYA